MSKKHQKIELELGKLLQQNQQQQQQSSTTADLESLLSTSLQQSQVQQQQQYIPQGLDALAGAALQKSQPIQIQPQPTNPSKEFDFLTQLNSLPSESQQQIKEFYTQFLSQKLTKESFIKKSKEIISKKQSNQQQNQANNQELIQDVIKAAGVDLSKEQELLLKDLENDFTEYETETIKIEISLQRIRKIIKNSGISKIEKDCDFILNYAILQRLIKLIEESIRISKFRLETKREDYEIELVDGEKLKNYFRSRIGAVKRPLVWLERFEKNEEIKLALEMKGSVSEEGRNALLEAGIKDDEEEGEGVVLDEEGSKQGQSKKGYWKERDEEIIRQKQANVTALKEIDTSLSGEKYSWLTAANTTSDDKTNLQQKQIQTQQTTTLTGFGLPRHDVRQRQLNSRKVTVADLLYALKLESGKELGFAKMRKSGVVNKVLAGLSTGK